MQKIHYFIGFLLIITALARPAGAAGLGIEGFRNGETLRYSLPLFQGTLDDKAAKSVQLQIRSGGASRGYSGIAHEGRYKVLGELTPGRNDIEVRCGSASASMTLHYARQTNPTKVRAVYFVDSTLDTSYDTPFARDNQDFRGKLDTALKLMQSFTADWMQTHGHGRKTFNLDLDERGRVVVHVVNVGDKSLLAGQDRNVLFASLSAKARAVLPKGNFINVGTVAFSRHLRGETGATYYTALGGGGLALLGGACFYSWPSSIQEVQERFMLDMPIDPLQIHADDWGRNAVWATAANTIGSLLHELGHAMGLPHAQDWRCIMSSGGRFFNRHYTFIEPPSQHNRTPLLFKQDRGSWWSPVSAACLARGKALAMDENPLWSLTGDLAYALDTNKGEVVVSSSHGVAFLADERLGQAAHFMQAPPGGTAPRQMRLALRDLLARFVTMDIQFRALDILGNGKNARLQDLLSRSCFLREWKSSPSTLRAWSDNGTLPRMDAKKIMAIAGKCRSAAPFTSTAEFVDLNLALGQSSTRHILGYALSSVRLQRDTTVRILYDLDDAGRIWINGALQAEKKAASPATKDKSSFQVRLRRGDNPILVETFKRDKAWGFYLRICDMAGNPLQVVDGELKPLLKPEFTAIPLP